jgi:hypothetical protein
MSETLELTIVYEDAGMAGHGLDPASARYEK